MWRWFKRIGAGAAVTGLLGVTLIGGGIWYWRHQVNARHALAEAAQVDRANAVFAPVFEKFAEAELEPAYDIDKTIRVIHELDLALSHKDSLESYLQELATQDYRDVAPEVLDARKEIMEVLLKLYAKQVESGDQQAMWEMTSELLLTAFSVVDFDGGLDAVGPTAGLSIDREQAQELLRDMRQEQHDHRDLVRDMAQLETELLSAMTDYSEVYYRYMDEWDDLSVMRDRAYLAAHNQDWTTVADAATIAVQKAPQEREAHLLLAMAKIEQGGGESDEEILGLLADYIEDHPSSTAPAFQLMGIQHTNRGRIDEARLAFQQSAAYYPRQAEELTDMLDPYTMRSFLRKSREGGFILELYKSTMLGAGYWSPDLQLAELLFESGDIEAGKEKVLDHFSRRRNQQQWDFVLSDIQYCYDLLGPRFWEIFPEDHYVDLEISETMFGSQLSVGVNNRSDKTLRNASLLLALQFTDMYATDYEVMAAERTIPAVPPHEITDFGKVEIELDLFGGTKTVDDIVRHRAILITNEAVLWVDTDEYKIERAEAEREARRAGDTPGRPVAVTDSPTERFPEYQSTVDTIIAGLTDAVSVEVESRYGRDNVLIELPKELSLLRPLFRLKYGDEVLAAQDNVIEGDSIQLRFAGVDNFDAEGIDRNDLELLVASPFGDIVVNWVSDGTVSWRLAGVERE
jgi:tetratricopeptide (TPR) repeat protein